MSIPLTPEERTSLRRGISCRAPGSIMADACHDRELTALLDECEALTADQAITFRELQGTRAELEKAERERDEARAGHTRMPDCDRHKLAVLNLCQGLRDRKVTDQWPAIGDLVTHYEREFGDAPSRTDQRDALVAQLRAAQARIAELEAQAAKLPAAIRQWLDGELASPTITFERPTLEVNTAWLNNAVARWQWAPPPTDLAGWRELLADAERCGEWAVVAWANGYVLRALTVKDLAGPGIVDIRAVLRVPAFKEPTP